MAASKGAAPSAQKKARTNTRKLHIVGNGVVFRIIFGSLVISCSAAIGWVFVRCIVVSADNIGGVVLRGGPRVSRVCVHRIIGGDAGIRRSVVLGMCHNRTQREEGKA